MILGPISGLDCLVFLVLLAPQLIINVGFFPTLICAFQALPFICMFICFIITEMKPYPVVSYQWDNEDRETLADVKFSQITAEFGL